MNTAPNPQSPFAGDYNANPVAMGSHSIGSTVRALTLGNKLVFIGGTVALVGFFLPWATISILFSKASVSGFSLAREMLSALWAFPATMVAAMVLSYKGSAQKLQTQVFLSQYFVSVGAAWAGPLLGTATIMTMDLGGICALVGSLCVLAGGIIQVRKSALGL